MEQSQEPNNETPRPGPTTNNEGLPAAGPDFPDPVEVADVPAAEPTPPEPEVPQS